MAYDYNQIYSLLNAVSDEAFGGTAITVKDTDSLVSLGNQVFKSDEDLDAFYKALPVVIGRVITWYFKVTPQTRGIQVTPLTFGAILERITVYKIARAEQNGSWLSTQPDPFSKAKDDTDIHVNLIAKIAGYEIDKIVYDKQLRPAFSNAERMAAFVDLIFQDMYNGMQVGLNDTAALTECTSIAQIANFGQVTQFRNLLTEYNTDHTPLTLDEARENEAFLKWAAKQIKRTLSMMTRRVSTLYNIEKAEREIQTEDLRIHMLGDFASDLAFYLNADTYHKEFVEITGYEEISSWQGAGTDDSFDEVSKIFIENGEDIPETELSGVICSIFHAERMGCMIRDIRTKSLYNPKGELTNYYHKADIGYFILPDMPQVVFYLAESDFVPESDEDDGGDDGED
ncbi:MAG: hypothetical protein J6S85_26610 [Methanobrevibacter sp.]|nr:hypothetical protein [Methanobrevibacter sp.]MBO7717167.1 hypothetical protein [Methanobrevibacter sp.]